MWSKSQTSVHQKRVICWSLTPYSVNGASQFDRVLYYLSTQSLRVISCHFHEQHRSSFDIPFHIHQLPSMSGMELLLRATTLRNWTAARATPIGTVLDILLSGSKMLAGMENLQGGRAGKTARTDAAALATCRNLQQTKIACHSAHSHGRTRIAGVRRHRERPFLPDGAVSPRKLG